MPLLEKASQRKGGIKGWKGKEAFNVGKWLFGDRHECGLVSKHCLCSKPASALQDPLRSQVMLPREGAGLPG